LPKESVSVPIFESWNCTFIDGIPDFVTPSLTHPTIIVF